MTTPLDEAAFWAIVATATHLPDEQRPEAIQDRLARLSPAEIVGFDLRMRLLLRQAHRWDVWGAAYLINGGCSDDGFDYFRGWLIGQGERVYRAALADPDSLAGVVDAQGEVELEDLLYVAGDAYEQLTGASLPPAGPEFGESEVAGEDWDFDDEDECRRRLPRLSAIFLDEG